MKNLVVDESVDYEIIRRLVKEDFEIFSIHDRHPGISDDEVLRIANDLGCLLITEDKDFGELTFRLRLSHKGILLVRLSGLSRTDRIESTVEAIKKHYKEFQLNFSVLTETGLRIKRPQR